MQMPTFPITLQAESGEAVYNQTRDYLCNQNDVICTKRHK